MKPTTLYRFFAAGELLYVGISLSVLDRWRNHRENQPWWATVTHGTMEHYPNRELALVAELIAIHKENPRHNIAGTQRKHGGKLLRKRSVVAADPGQFVILGGSKPRPIPLKPEPSDADWSSLPMADVRLLITAAAPENQ